ncbi:glycosyltransferase family 9 protein [Helicobacter aurati]|nr:glycosyltransferase family 9 protein [Helicobacter aurati]
MYILIRLPNWLGDAIMLTPTIVLLRKVYPNVRCILVGNALTANVFCLNDHIIKIFIDDSKKAKNIIQRLQAINALAANINVYLAQSQIKLDCAITAQNNFFSAFLLSKISAKMTVGYGDKNAFGVRKFLLTHNVKFASGRPPACNHQVLSYANLLLPILPYSFFQSIDLQTINYISNPQASSLQNKLFSQVEQLHLIDNETKQQNHNNASIVAISTGASYGISKMWLPEYFSEVAITLLKRGHIVRLYGAKNEEEYNARIERSILHILPQEHHTRLQNLTGATNIPSLIQSLQQCSLYIGNDSGSMHIAKALKIPSIVFFGPMPLAWCSPWSPNFYQQQFLTQSHKQQAHSATHTESIAIDSSIIVKKTLPCMPCYKRVCPLSHHNCMRLITPDEVLNIAESLLLQKQ